MAELTAGRTGADWPVRIAAGLNGFALVAVNYWIYRARAVYIERHIGPGDRPPTISKAIGDQTIGQPFGIWITISAIALAIGVMALAFAYSTRVVPGLGQRERAGRRLVIAMAGLQIVACIGMHLLSVNRFPAGRDMHMVGSYLFFGAQAGVVLLFAVFNLVLLRSLRGGARNIMSRSWTVWRLVLCAVVSVMVVVYFALFTLKGGYDFATYPWVWYAYTGLEPVVISGFLLVLALAHVEFLFGRAARSTPVDPAQQGKGAANALQGGQVTQGSVKTEAPGNDRR